MCRYAAAQERCARARVAGESTPPDNPAMPVYLVSVNGHGRREPERYAIVTSRVSVATAIEWALYDWPRQVRDLDVEQLSDRDDCWYVAEPRRAA